jgi:large subunit ribosomal protein L23
MGLLDRWIKRKTEEQLNKDVVVKPEVKKDAAVLSTASKPTGAKKNVRLKKSAVAENNEEKKPEEKKVKKSSSVIKKDQPETKIKETKEGKMSEYAREIIIRPLTTEKTTYLESENKYVFLVARSSTKNQIKQAVKELYQVRPLAVQVIHVQGKRVHFGRVQGNRSDYKKTIITLPKNSTIKIHETV